MACLQGYSRKLKEKAASSLVTSSDIDINDNVDFADINEVLANWGGGGPDGDANGDNVVDFEDILLILANWGECP